MDQGTKKKQTRRRTMEEVAATKEEEAPTKKKQGIVTRMDKSVAFIYREKVKDILALSP